MKSAQANKLRAHGDPCRNGARHEDGSDDSRSEVDVARLDVERQPKHERREYGEDEQEVAGDSASQGITLGHRARLRA